MTISLSVLTTITFAAAIWAVIGWVKYDACVHENKGLIADISELKARVKELREERNNIVSRLSSR